MKSSETTQWQGVVIPFDNDMLGFISHRKQFASGKQKDIATALGLSDQSLISRFENGEFILDPRTFSLFGLITNSHIGYSLLPRQPNQGGLLIKAPASGKDRREYRIRAGLKSHEMANLMGLSSKSIISNYEHEKKHPSTQNWTLFLLATDQHPHFEILPKNTDVVTNQT